MKESQVKLLEYVASGANGGAANDLLNEFYSGMSILHLRQLLRSSNSDAVHAGAWIASELGDQVLPIMADVVVLLDSDDRHVKFYALQAICEGADESCAEAVARSTRLVCDDDEVVQRAAIDFLAYVDPPLLKLAAKTINDDRLSTLLSWLSDVAKGWKSEAVATFIRSENPLERRFAAAAANRYRYADPSLLRDAADSSDSVVSDYAKYQLDDDAEA